MAVPPVPVLFLTKGHLPRLSRQSRLSANKSDEMVPGTVHRSPGISFTALEISGKLKVGDRRGKAVRTVIASSRVPYLKMR